MSDRLIPNRAARWVDLLVRPRRFFGRAVVPGDQAPGLLFAMAVVLIEESMRVFLVPGAVPDTAAESAISAVLAVAVAVLLVTPVALHLVAAVATLLLVGLVPERATVSETVQVLAYATAPCAFAGVPDPAIRVLVAGYGTALLVVGIGEVHDIGRQTAAAVAALPAVIMFGYGFRGFAAVADLLARWYII